jgi:catechol-2,3-dioxygenase
VSSTVCALGEVALRVNNLAAMRRFYENVLGLWPLGVFDDAVFYRIAPGHDGHTQVFVLFARGVPVSVQASTVDHIAFAIDRKDFESERSRLEGLGLQVEVAEHAWVHWRSLYVHDPEGNEIELVCYDPTVLRPEWEYREDCSRTRCCGRRPQSWVFPSSLSCCARHC